MLVPPQVAGAIAASIPVEAAGISAVVPESAEALPAGAPVERSWLDRPGPDLATCRHAPEEPWTTARNHARSAAA